MIQNLEGVLYVIKLINGKMRTPKINALYKMIDWLNSNKYKSITKLPLDHSNIESNAWLSGFIDTDGSFSIKGFTSKRAYISFQFYICQRKLDKSGDSMIDIMIKISEFLNVKLKDRNINDHKQFTITTSNIKSNLIQIKYLTNYPLFTSKYLNYKSWKTAYEIFQLKEKNSLCYEKIKNLKLNMNKSRTNFSWKHQNNFY